MWRKFAGYSLLSTYAFCFFTVVFHAVAHAQTTPIAQDKPQILGAQTTAQPSQTTQALTANQAVQTPTPPLPTPTMFATNLVESKTIPSITPTAVPTETPQPTATPEPTKTPAPTTPPPPAAPQSTANPGGLSADKLFSMVNDYRASQGLPAFQKDDKTCSLAASRAPEISGEIASGTMHSGLAARALPYWNTENIISMNSEEAAFNWWINDKIHHDAIVSHNVYSCVACSGNSCAEEFTSYQPK